jgi:hypothetical protein
MISTFLSIFLALLPTVANGLHTYEAVCQPGLYGYYQPATNSLTVCAGLSERDTQTTIAHELIHAVQDARDGFDNSTIVPLLTESQRNALANTPHGQWVNEQLTASYAGKSEHVLDLEFEAWYFEELIRINLF